MTIAACYLSPEGVVFGSDSTSTYSTGQPLPAGDRYYNYAQKIFEIGECGSTLGILVWGMAEVGDLSYRTLVAQFADTNFNQQTNTVQDVANRFGQLFWPQYTNRRGPQILRFHQLAANPNATADEQKERDALLRNLSGGFCIGGNLFHDRTPQAFEISYGPTMPMPIITSLAMNQLKFWGVPNFITRLFLGIDPELFGAILQSGHWQGNPADLSSLVDQRRLAPPGALPIREAVDWVHASVYVTIKAMKFSQLAPVCGGPVEIAIITTDRPFRWVCHKRLDAALPYYGGSCDG